MTAPHTVTLAFYGGPADSYSRPWSTRSGLVPAAIAGTVVGGEFPGGTYRKAHAHPERADWWIYVWIADRSGRRNPCGAGCAEYPGARCPSRQTGTIR